MTDVVVVGAGIVGASVAYHLARAGAGVVLVDASLPASGATGASFAWIGAGGAGVSADQALLRRSVLADHRRLAAEVPGVRVRWTGSLEWGDDGEPIAPGPLAAGEHLVDAAQVRRLEPRLRTPPVLALHRPGDGAVDPVATTEALVRAARGHGARTGFGVAVRALRVEGGRVVGVETSAGPIRSRTVVLTAGAGTPALCAPLGFDLPVAPSPALLVRLTAPPGLVRTLVATPRLEVRQSADGDLLATGGSAGGTTRDGLHRAGREVRDRVAATFAGTDGVRPADVRVGTRPMPADGSPVIGPVPGVEGVSVAVVHSGVTLAPVVGRLVAAEVLSGSDAEELHALRPARFLG